MMMVPEPKLRRALYLVCPTAPKWQALQFLPRKEIAFLISYVLRRVLMSSMLTKVERIK
jgi:hypothetical protein